MFDVLTEFFYHDETVVQRAALEVYIRRSYVAYLLEKISFTKSSTSAASMIVFSFSLPRTSPDDQDSVDAQAARLTQGALGATKEKGLGPRKVHSIQDMQAYEQMAKDSTVEQTTAAPLGGSSVARMGVMAAFTSVAHLKSEFDTIAASFASHVQVW